ncbi:AtpZ/AtpI family protein [Dissulfurispira sp.]|uniref:AtpZ/AtpI family protein n=1 Tax=Dissulfurispira sp. TaxID=2817609 RepID=UPI002FD8AA14
MTEKQPEKTLLKQLLEASSVGIHLVVSTFVGLAIGYGLDKLFGTSPYLTVIFLIIGIIAGFRELIRIAKKQEE